MQAQMIDTRETFETYEALVRRAQASQGREREEAFSTLIDQFRFAAQSWAYQILGDAHATQDAAQEAFITAYERLDDLRDPAAFPSWLRRLVWTQCHRDLRQNNRAVPLDDSAPASDDPALTAEQRILHDRVHRAVEDLPAHEREVITLFYLSGYSQQEIAEKLALPLTTIKKRLQYGREHLRETLPALNMLMLRAA
jgi:RNA polymerase sigma factor (sigma-70 family)